MKAARTFLGLTVLLALVVLPAIPASAGGGCHGGPVSDVKGAAVHNTVDLEGMCFVQTIIRIRPGQSVTWKNGDPMVHMVTGAGVTWGSLENLSPGKTVTYSFTNPGIYPYACMIHAGMVGAVVVGNGGTPSGTASGGAGVLPVLSSPSAAGATSIAGQNAANRTPASSAGPWRVIALVTLGLLAAAAAGLGIQRFGLRRSQARAGVS
jgi:plastocyanin